MQYVKLPVPIEAVKFDPSHPPEKAKIRSDGGGEQWQVWNELHQSWIFFKSGDWLNITSEEDIYPISREVFEKTYVEFHG